MSMDVIQRVRDMPKPTGGTCVVVISMDNDTMNVSLANLLRKNGVTWRIFVRVRRTDGVSKLLLKDEIHPFGDLANICSLDNLLRS